MKKQMPFGIPRRPGWKTGLCCLAISGLLGRQRKHVGRQPGHRGYARLISDVGVDDEVSENSTVVFQVFADDKKVFDSGTMRPDSETKRVSVSVSDVRYLRLVVTDGEDGINSDHADWAGARLVQCPR